MSLIEIAIVLCLAMGGECQAEESRVTVYAPQMGGINCEEPCDVTASGWPVMYGVTVACSPEHMWDWVYLEGIGWRRCLDTGGWITGSDVDVAIPVEECIMVETEYGEVCWHPWSDEREVVFVAER